MFYFPFVALVVVGYLYRHDLGIRSLLIYFGIWAAGLSLAVMFSAPPGFFIAGQCLVVIAMLIHAGANPRL